MRRISKLISFMKHKQKNKSKASALESFDELYIKSDNDIMSKDIEINRTIMQNKFCNSSDVVYYEFKCFIGVKALVIYIDKLIDTNMLNRDVINPFILITSTIKFSANKSENIKRLFPVSGVKEQSTIMDTINELVSGATVIFIDGIDKSFSISTQQWLKRNISEPESETVVRGPKEGFIENIEINRSLLRQKIKNNNLVFEDFTIGTQTNTCISICYMNGIANEKIVQEVRTRLNNINTDCILESGYIEQYIEDEHFTILETVGNTEKPDVVAAKILEGRVAIFCDGTPHVLTVPYLFVESLQTCEDYYMRPFIASMLRILRVLALIISLLSCPVYVALETFHQEMIPTVLLITMAGSSSHIALPAFVEALLMVIMYHFLRESGTRLPKPIGPAISIVGALVLGDAAVKAGLVSAPMIIIIAVTAICGFIIPTLTEFLAIFRYILLFLAGFIGLFGIFIGVFMMTLHMISLRSFGVSYCSPFGPTDKDGLKDSIIRFPLWAMKKRPKSISNTNIIRQRNTKEK